MHHNMATEFPRCGWLMPHRDKHACGCICVLVKGHDGRHRCSADLASLDAEAATDA